MSQSGMLKVADSVLPPDVATSYVTNSGTAIPAGNVLNVLGGTVAAGSTPFRSIGSGNTVTYQAQISQAIAATDATKIGLSAYNSSQFTVDANGFVSLSGGSGVAIQTINGDTGSISGSTVTIYAHNSTQQAGASVKFVNSGSTSTFTVSDASHNTLIGKSSGNATLSGTQNVGFGDNSLLSLTIGSENTCFGYDAGVAITTGNFNTCLGNAAGAALKTGINNLLIGNSAGANYAGAESSNIILGQVTGTTSESNVIRIGTQGSSTGQQNKAFIAGIVGVTASNPELVTINSSTGQLGIQALTQNGVLYGGASNAPAQTAAVANGVLITSNSNVPSLLANSGTPGFVLTANAGAPPSWQAGGGGGSFNGFSAYLSGNQTNTTGDGTVYTIPFDSTAYNIGGNFNTGTGTYTAPSTGRYLFTGILYLFTFAASNTQLTAQIVSTANTYPIYTINPFLMNGNGTLAVPISITIPMTAGDTAQMTIDVQGVSKGVGVGGTITLTSWQGTFLG